MVIECEGRVIRVWVNGDKVNEGRDCTADSGSIAIQAEGAEVESGASNSHPWRDTRPGSEPGRAPPGSPCRDYNPSAMSPVYAFSLGPISGLELMVVGVASVLIFGGRLPEVAMRAIAHVMRARRALSQMWRDTGLEDERAGSAARSRPRSRARSTTTCGPSWTPRPRTPARAAARARDASAETLGAHDDDEFGIDPDADRREAYSFEPVDEAIAVGDDHAVSGEEPLGFVEDPGHAPAMEADPEADAPDEDGLRAS